MDEYDESIAGIVRLKLYRICRVDAKAKWGVDAY